MTGINFNKEALVNSYNAGGNSSLLAKAGAPSLAGRTADSVYKNLVYTPVTPCRIVSTTGDARGKIRAGTSRSYRAHGTGAVIGAQGGDSGGCMSNGNRDAFGYLFNITVHHVNQGHVRIYPAHETSTITSIVNFIPGAAVANSTIVKTTHLGGDDFKIFAARDAHVIVDVMGYFDKPEMTKPDTYIAKSPSKTIQGNNFSRLFSPNCPSSYRLISGGMQASDLRVHVSGSYPDTDISGANLSANRWRCRAQNTSGSAHTVSCYAICLRIPGK